MMLRTRTCSLMMLLLIASSTCHAQHFAAEMVEYVPGAVPAPPFGLTDNSAALGKPASAVPGSPEFVFDDGQGTVTTFPATPAEPLNPFAPHFDAAELTQIGAGGHMTLRLERFVQIGSGLELGVFGNVGLVNVDGSGDTSQRQASSDVLGVFQSFGVDDVVIEVSETGTPGSWAALNGGARVTIQNPTSFYTDATGLVGPTEHVADLQPLLASLTESDFGKPLAGGITQFNDLTITEMETLLAGSAGGDWFDLSGLMAGGEPIDRVGYVRFSDPSSTFELMALSINSSLAGAPVPEPSTIALALAGLLTLVCRRHR